VLCIVQHTPGIVLSEIIVVVVNVLQTVLFEDHVYVKRRDRVLQTFESRSICFLQHIAFGHLDGSRGMNVGNEKVAMVLLSFIGFSVHQLPVLFNQSYHVLMFQDHATARKNFPRQVSGDLGSTVDKTPATFYVAVDNKGMYI